MARRREFNVFSLSFLDIMSCGFGAVILIFIVINHASETSGETRPQRLSQAKRLEEEVKAARETLAVVRNSVQQKDDDIVTAEAEVKRLAETIKQLEAQLAELAQDGSSQEQTVEALKSEIQALEAQAANLKASIEAEGQGGRDLRAIAGEGDRQYLTGMKMGGGHILVLLDASASMLDKTIVNVIRRRNLPDSQKTQAAKWQRAVRTVEWIVAKLPREARFQVLTFNETAQPAFKGKGQDWLQVTRRQDLDGAIEGVKRTVPAGGTSLASAFAAASRLSPAPDNIYLIIDSLPTLGQGGGEGLIDSQERLALFTDSLLLLPDSPVNVILFPMEGDPFAAPSYWQLAQTTGGSFLAPPKDWP